MLLWPGADARSEPSRRDRRLPRARRPAADGGRLPARRSRRADRRRARRRRRGVRRGGGLAAGGVLRHALPADRPEHVGPGGGAPGRRAQVAQRRRHRRAAPDLDPRSRRLRGEVGGSRRARSQRGPPGGAARPVAELSAAVDELQGRLAALESGVTLRLPATADGSGGHAGDVISAIDPGFRAQEISFVVAQLARNVDLAAAADRRSWIAQLLGRRPDGAPGALASIYERAGTHVDRHSLWLRNSLRGALGLGLAVLVARLTGVQHAFWVVFGTLSVLRSSALVTGQNVARAVLGTTAGFVVGGIIVWLVGTDRTLLWVLLPLAVLFAAWRRRRSRSPAGQAAFTLTLLILFNILAPEGWQIGLVRIEDVAIGGAVSLAVGVLLWPRGAARRCGAPSPRPTPTTRATSPVRCGSAWPLRLGQPDPRRADRRGERRGRLVEAPRRHVPDVPGRARRQAASPGRGDQPRHGRRRPAARRRRRARLWRVDDVDDGDRAAARAEILAGADRVTGWYEAFAASLVGQGDVPPAARPGCARRRPFGRGGQPRPRGRRRPGQRDGRARPLDRRPPRRGAAPAGHAGHAARKVVPEHLAPAALA